VERSLAVPSRTVIAAADCVGSPVWGLGGRAGTLLNVELQGAADSPVLLGVVVDQNAYRLRVAIDDGDKCASEVTGDPTLPLKVASFPHLHTDDGYRTTLEHDPADVPGVRAGEVIRRIRARPLAVPVRTGRSPSSLPAQLASAQRPLSAADRSSSPRPYFGSTTPLDVRLKSAHTLPSPTLKLNSKPRARKNSSGA
jgi:hypothetical protein